MFYFVPVKGLTLVLDVGAPEGHYWHIYHSQAVTVTVKKPVVPYLRPHSYSLLCRWKKRDNIPVQRFTLSTFVFVGLKSLVQMDMGSEL